MTTFVEIKKEIIKDFIKHAPNRLMNYYTFQERPNFMLIYNPFLRVFAFANGHSSDVSGDWFHVTSWSFYKKRIYLKSMNRRVYITAYNLNIWCNENKKRIKEFYTVL